MIKEASTNNTGISQIKGKISSFQKKSQFLGQQKYKNYEFKITQFK